MMWDRVIQAMVVPVLADPALAAIFTPADERVRFGGSGAHVVPLLEYHVIDDTETELWEPVTIQWDIFTDTLQDLLTAERRLRGLFHLDLPAEIGGLMLFAGYAGGDTLAAPDRDGYFGRAVRFRLTPLREKYQPAP